MAIFGRYYIVISFERISAVVQLAPCTLDHCLSSIKWLSWSSVKMPPHHYTSIALYPHKRSTRKSGYNLSVYYQKGQRYIASPRRGICGGRSVIQIGYVSLKYVGLSLPLMITSVLHNRSRTLWCRHNRLTDGRSSEKLRMYVHTHLHKT